MNDRMPNLLYRSFDQTLSREEQQALSQAFSASPQLLEEQKRLAEMRQLIKSGAVRSFKPFFATRVMHRIKRQAGESEEFIGSLMWGFRRVAVAGAAAILLLLANNVFLEKNRSVESMLGLPQLTIEDTWQLEFLFEEDK